MAKRTAKIKGGYTKRCSRMVFNLARKLIVEEAYHSTQWMLELHKHTAHSTQSTQHLAHITQYTVHSIPQQSSLP